MTEVVAVAAIAEKVITSALASIMTGLLRRVGRSLGEKAFPKQPISALAETALGGAKPFLISLVEDLPPNISIAQIQKALSAFEAQEIIRELFYVSLAEPSSPLNGRLTDDLKYHLLRELGPAFETLAGHAASLASNSVKAVADTFSASISAKYKQTGTFDAIIADNLLISTVRASRPLSDSRRRFANNEAYQDLVEWEAAYRRQVALDHGRLEPPDLETKRDIRIENLYVPARIAPAGQEGAPAVTPLQLMAKAERAVLLGDPGAGKTTAARYVSQAYARNKRMRVPFTVTLRKFAEDGRISQSIAAWIEKEAETKYQCPPPKHAIDYLLSSGRALVIFDGLDELLDPSDRREVTSRVELFLNKYPSAQALVTSRRVGYEQARLSPEFFDTYFLSAFQPEDINEYVRKWFSVVGQLQGDELDRECRTFVEEARDLPDLTRNPLMLALICILYKGQGYLPRNRSEVYEQCANLLFKKWDSGRHIHVQLRAKSQIDSAIKHLAYWMLTDRDGTEAVTEAALVTEVSDYLRDAFLDQDERRSAAVEFVEFCTGRAWVFSDAGTTAEGMRLFRFTHRTFMEYFAAYQLSRLHDTPEELAQELHPRIVTEQWEVVGPLAVQIKNEHSILGADRIIRALLDLSENLGVLERERINSFCWSCLGSILPTPETCSKLVRSTIDSSLDLVTEAGQYHPGLAMDRILGSLPEIRDTVSSNVYETLLLAAGGRGRRAAKARLASVQFPSPHFSISVSREVLEDWSRIARPFFVQHSLEIARGSNSDQVLRSALALGRIDIAELHTLAKQLGVDPFAQLFVEVESFDGYSVWLPWALGMFHALGSKRELNRISADSDGYLTSLVWIAEHYPKSVEVYDRRLPAVLIDPPLSAGDMVAHWYSAIPEQAYWGVVLALLPFIETTTKKPRRRLADTRYDLLLAFDMMGLIEKLDSDARAVCRAWVVGAMSFVNSSMPEPQPMFDPF